MPSPAQRSKAPHRFVKRHGRGAPFLASSARSGDLKGHGFQPCQYQPYRLNGGFSRAALEDANEPSVLLIALRRIAEPRGGLR